jgi:type I restriction enzyme M protein
LELLLSEPILLEKAKERWKSAQISKKLNYPVFMATSERSGKSSSGDYILKLDENRNIVTNEHGDPLIDQDCISYVGDVHIAEGFVKWAKKQKLSFWQGED